MESARASSPASYATSRRKWRQSADRGDRGARRRVARDVFRRRRNPGRAPQDGAAQGDDRRTVLPMLCGSAFKNKGVQPLLDAVVDFLPSPLEAKTIVGIDPKSGDDIIAQARRQGTVRGARVQDRDRPVRQPDVFPRLLRHARQGLVRLQRAQRAQGAHRAHPAHARQPSRRHRLDRRGRHRRGRRPDRHAHRRHALRREESDRARDDHVPGARHLAGDRAEDQGRPGQARHRRSARLAQEDPTFRMRTDEETQQTIIGGMGELHLEIILDRLQARVQSRSQRRQAASRLQRSDHEDGRKARQFVRQSGGKGQFGDVWFGSSRASPARATSSSRQSSAAPFRRNTSSRSARASGSRRRAARWPAIRCSTSRRRSSTARTTMSTRRKWRSRSRRSMAFKEANRAAGPILLEPIMEVEVTTPQGLHRRDQRRLEPPPRHDPVAPKKLPAARRSSRRTSRSRRCSVTRPTCAPRRKAARRTRWSSPLRESAEVGRGRDRREGVTARNSPPRP